MLFVFFIFLVTAFMLAIVLSFHNLSLPYNNPFPFNHSHMRDRLKSSHLHSDIGSADILNAGMGQSSPDHGCFNLVFGVYFAPNAAL